MQFAQPGVVPGQYPGFGQQPIVQQPPPRLQAPAAPQQRPQPQTVATQPPVKPKILGQSPDEPERRSTPPPLPPPGPPPVPPPPPVSAKVTLPTPEELGLMPAKTAEPTFDWSGLERRLHTLRAVGFQMNQTPQGGWKVVCVLPTNQADKTHRIETEADNRGDAVRSALDQAEKWAGLR